MAAGVRKLITDVQKLCYEKVDNDARMFRFAKEEEEDIKRKIRYLNVHLRDIQQQPKTEFEQIMVYGHLGNAFYKLYDFEEARKNYSLQLEMAVDCKDGSSQRMALCNLGVLDKINYNFSGACDKFNQSLAIAVKINNRYAQARIYNNLAIIYELLMDYEKAIEFQKLRLQIATEIQDRDGEIKACASLGALYHVLSDFPNSVRFYEQLMDSLRRSLRILDTLADDESVSEDEGYVDTVDEPEDDQEDDKKSKKRDKKNKGKSTKTKNIFSRNKK